MKIAPPYPFALLFLKSFLLMANFSASAKIAPPFPSAVFSLNFTVVKVVLPSVVKAVFLWIPTAPPLPLDELLSNSEPEIDFVRVS
nr:hypothetical protein [Desulfovibrio piger]